jgi:hypothetical protein
LKTSRFSFQDSPWQLFVEAARKRAKTIAARQKGKGRGGAERTPHKATVCVWGIPDHLRA